MAFNIFGLTFPVQ